MDFQKNRYKSLIDLLGDVKEQQILDLMREYQEFVNNNSKEHEIVTWLNQWVNKASDINFATHVGKLTHSSSKSSSIIDATIEKNDSYLTTNQLKNIVIDTASSNAASLPIADVLKLTENGISVLDLLKNGQNMVFKKITNDDDIVSKWCNQLEKSYSNTKQQSYFLSKQIYFPTNNQNYHLLMPLTSSSLVHALYLEHRKYWDKEQESARLQKNNKKYFPIDTVTYPNKACLHRTASNHSNASLLNGNRLGKIILFAAMPPQWKSQMQSYINKNSIFDKVLAFELRDEINDLRNYLLLLKNKALSISEPKRNAIVKNKLKAISEQFFNYLETINANEDKSGWTINSKLPTEQQLAFEPWRKDEIAEHFKMNNEWRKTLSQSYGRWLNRQLLQKENLKLTTIHADLWSDCFLFELREMIAIQEASL